MAIGAGSRRDAVPYPRTLQIIADMRLCTRSPLVEGWSLHSLRRSDPGENAINKKRFKKRLCCRLVYTCMWVSCACVQKPDCSRVSPLLFFSSCVFHVFQPHFYKYLYRV